MVDHQPHVQSSACAHASVCFSLLRCGVTTKICAPVTSEVPQPVSLNLYTAGGFPTRQERTRAEWCMCGCLPM